MDTQRKECSHCKQSKPFTEFGKNATAKDGLQVWCKSCRYEHQHAKRDELNSYQKSWRIKNLDKEHARHARYNATHREQEKEYRARVKAASPDKVRTHSIKWNQENKDKIHGYMRKWRLNHPDQVVAQQRKWLATHREQARMHVRNHEYRKRANGGSVSVNEWKDLLKQYGYACAYCGSKEDLTMDHAIPLSRGGRHDKSNIVPACRSCNSRKGTRTVEEFEQQQSARRI